MRNSFSLGKSYQKCLVKSWESWDFLRKILRTPWSKGKFIYSCTLWTVFFALLSSFSNSVNRDLSGFTNLIPCFFFLKIKTATSQSRFKWNNDKLSNLKKSIPELKSSYVKFSFWNINSFHWLQGFVVIIVIQH